MNEFSFLSREMQIDRLLQRLATIRDPDDVMDTERELWCLWSESGNPAVDFMLDAATDAIRIDRLNTALALMNGVIEMAPDFAEGWNRRATVFIVFQNYAAAFKDLSQSLSLEPRHFGALWSLSMVHEAKGEIKEAIDVLYKVKDLNPHFEGLGERLDTLHHIILTDKMA